ncbi:unnamed protein product [Strongylus vulgaris]|uniref:Uncharacterized protein n=1 Tax=Strongylus vulgaris TaxID=40348 RepID=A0A3P7J5H1_STRVU|nr:unnamed protein product [Strongylus vulgaris]
MEKRMGDYIGYLTNSQVIDLIFEHLVDVVVVKRNDTMTKRTPFIKRLSTKLYSHDIKLSMMAIADEKFTRGITGGCSMSLCSSDTMN